MNDNNGNILEIGDVVLFRHDNSEAPFNFFGTIAGFLNEDRDQFAEIRKANDKNTVKKFSRNIRKLPDEEATLWIFENR